MNLKTTNRKYPVIFIYRIMYNL